MSGLLALGGAGLQAAGQIKAGRLAEAEGKASQRMAEFNARQLERQAKEEQEAAGVEAERVARAEKIAAGRAIARGGKSGVALEGSRIDELADMASTFAIDRNLILRRGLLRAGTLKGQASIQRVQGKLAKIRGRETKRASLLKAGGTLLAGGFAASSAGKSSSTTSPFVGPPASLAGSR